MMNTFNKNFVISTVEWKISLMDLYREKWVSSLTGHKISDRSVTDQLDVRVNDA